MTKKKLEKLLELYVDEFIVNLAQEFMKEHGGIDGDEVDEAIKKYAEAHEGVYGMDNYDDLQRWFGDELAKYRYFG